MANQQKSGGSGWGSFLSQTFAGMEQQLDTMLAEGGQGGPHPGRATLKESEKQKEKDDSKAATQDKTTTSAIPAADDHNKGKPIAPARTGSHQNRANDRLQERLAKALAAKKASHAPSEASSARQSVDEGARPRQSDDAGSTRSRESGAADAQPRAASPMRIGSAAASPNKERAMSQAADSDIAKPTGVEVEKIKEQLDILERDSTDSGRDSQAAMPAADAPSESAIVANSAEAQAEHQEELHRLVEQVDALQSKLQYLAKETGDAARKAVAEAGSGTSEKKLAEKDEKISLLMEEGRSMAANEQKLRAVIKKLRAQLADGEKAMAELKTAQDKTKAEVDNLRNRTSRLEEIEKEQAETQRQLSRTRADLDAIKSDLSLKESTIKSLRDDLQKAQDEADAAQAKATQDALVAEQRRAKDLEENIATLQVEKNLVADRAKKNAQELQEKTDRAAERARVSELELKGELQALEGKLEAMRALAEEASSGAVGDSQAKLLRQVETLQTQHAIATENWQGIEANLVARVGSLEKERDEALKRESEMRKKARETAMRCKRQEEEIEDLNGKMPNHQQDLDALQSRADSAEKRAEAAEAALAQAKAEFEKQQQQQNAWKSDRGDQPDRRLWLEDAPGASSRNQSRPDSPLLSVPPRTFSSDFLTSEAHSGKGGRKVSTPNSPSGTFDPMASIRRMSSQPPIRPPILSPGFGPSSASMASFDPSPNDPLQTPTVGERDDILFDGAETTSSPKQMVQDMVSVSTAGAGPSVQLVERMSAAIRRLEAEKVASREELARISGQRDEARAEMVALLKESESGKAASKKVKELEAEVADINARYEATLELLGEKSELVEELRADVQDVKAMYRDLVESTVKG